MGPKVNVLFNLLHLGTTWRSNLQHGAIPRIETGNYNWLW